VHFIDSGTRVKTKHGKPKLTMKIDNPSTTTPTITSPTSLMWEDLVNNLKKGGSGELFNRKKVESAKKMIREAFVELYKGLNLLKSYRFLFFLSFFLICIQLIIDLVMKNKCHKLLKFDLITGLALVELIKHELHGTSQCHVRLPLINEEDWWVGDGNALAFSKRNRGHM
jgi:hypothetical protein